MGGPINHPPPARTARHPEQRHPATARLVRQHAARVSAPPQRAIPRQFVRTDGGEPALPPCHRSSPPTRCATPISTCCAPKSPCSNPPSGSIAPDTRSFPEGRRHALMQVARGVSSLWGSARSRACHVPAHPGRSTWPCWASGTIRPPWHRASACCTCIRHRADWSHLAAGDTAFRISPRGSASPVAAHATTHPAPRYPRRAGRASAQIFPAAADPAVDRDYGEPRPRREAMAPTPANTQKSSTPCTAPSPSCARSAPRSRMRLGPSGDKKGRSGALPPNPHWGQGTPDPMNWRRHTGSVVRPPVHGVWGPLTPAGGFGGQSPPTFLPRDPNAPPPKCA